MRKTLTTAILSLALSCFAFAGEIHTGSTPPPEPTPTPAVVAPTPKDETVYGEVNTPYSAESVMQTILEIMSVMPSLLF